MSSYRGHSSAGRAPAWHAGGQRFESAWLHSVRLLALQGVFFVAQGVALAGPAGQKSAKSSAKLSQVTAPAPQGLVQFWSGSEWLGCSGEGAGDGIAVLLQLTDPRQQLREARNSLRSIPESAMAV